MSFRPSLLVTLLLALLLLALSRPAAAWVEQTVLAHETRIELQRSGIARVEHKIKLRVRGGPLRTFPIEIADREVTVSQEDAALYVTDSGLAGRMPLPVAVEQRPDGPLRVEFDGGRGVRRGVYDLELRYEVDLLKQNGIQREGSMLQVGWIGPKWEDGVDTVKVTFAVPASGTEPRAVGEVRLGAPGLEAMSAPLGAFLTTLTRFPEVDELTLIRPHVASGEAVAWTVHIDPRALGELNDPRLSLAATSAEARAVSPTQRMAVLGIAGALALLFSVLLAVKHQHVVRAARVRGATPKPLVPVGVAARVALAGPLLSLSLAGQVFQDNPLYGSIGVLAVVALTAYRSERPKSAPRGPGRWLPLADADAFDRTMDRTPGWLDAGTLAGKLVLLVVLAGYGTGVYFLWLRAPYFAYIAALDVVVVLTLFGSGRCNALPPHPVFSTAPVLKRLAMQLRKSKALRGVRVRALGRVPTHASQMDELRLLVKPKQGLRGLRAVEVAVAWAQGSGVPVAFLQVLLRVADGSVCHEAVTSRMHRARWLRGRESYERVLVLSPPIPTLDLAAKLVEDVVAMVRVESPPAVEPRPMARPAHAARRPASVHRSAKPRRPGLTPRPPGIEPKRPALPAD